MNGDGDVLTGSSSGVRSAYCLYCTVCKNDYDSRADWLQHLGTPMHQKLARLECFRTWGEDKKMRECVVAVFCSFPLTYPGSVEDLLERFSSSGVDFFVTDFVWWPERPRVGFLQFESSKKVAEILKTLEQGSNGYVQNKLVQMKKAVDILKLEWKELLPPDTTEQETLEPLHGPPASEILVKKSKLGFDTPLQRQFSSICHSIEIPKEDFEHALEIVRAMKQVLEKSYPSAEVLMVRNYYLRLRNNSARSTLLLFAYIPESPSHPDGFEFIGPEKHTGLLAQFSRLLPEYKSRFFDKVPSSGTLLQNQKTSVGFHFTTHQDMIIEAQLCRLVQYLCTFDPRVRPLLTLVHFWAKSLDVRLSEQFIPMDVHHVYHPDPAALDWMVILFLIKKGILPSVREILERPHKALPAGKWKIDVGFSVDKDYAREWGIVRTPPQPEVNSDQFLVNVVTLLHQFFHFYSTNMERGYWLLNAKDGEIIRMEGTRLAENKLMPEETCVLKAIDKFRIYFLHPLYIHWRLSFCAKTWSESTCQKMKTTARALDKLQTGRGMDGTTLESVLLPSQVNSITIPPISPIRIPSSSCILEPQTPLQCQFNSVCQTVEIPEEEFSYALEITSNIQQVVKKYHPSVQVLMVRNYYLGLKNATDSSNILILYSYLSDNPSSPDDFTFLNKETQGPIFNSSEFQRLFPKFKHLTESSRWVGGCPYQHESTGFQFNLVTDPLSLGEAQLCRLVQYLCTFDPRVKPVLTLVHFWATSNAIHISEQFISNPTRHSNSPEPYALDWMVILVLIKEGILPSVREIVERPHALVPITKQKWDVGFHADPEYAAEWSRRTRPPALEDNPEEFLISVVTLALKFFQFYSDNLEEGCWLLNPKDGEIIRREGTHCHKSKLTPDETSALSMLQEKTDRPDREHLIISRYRIYMIHPLRIAWRLSFCVDTWTESTCQKMKMTAQALEQYLKGLSIKSDFGDGGTGSGVTLESVLGGGHLHEELECRVRKRQESEGSANIDGNKKRRKRV